MLTQANYNKKIEDAIIKVVAFYDIFEFPLTPFEIWQSLPVKVKLSNVFEELEKMEKNQLEQKNGYYFFKRKSELVETRRKRYNFTNRKLKKAKIVAGLFRFIPWIKFVGVANAIGFHNLRDSGDIDFFIVTAKNRIWISRFFCVGIIKFLGLRPKIHNSRDKICLSYFVDTSKLGMKELMLKKDIYYVYWLSNLIPIYDCGEIYNKLISANRWIVDVLPNWKPQRTAERIRIKIKNNLFYNEVVEIFLGGLEKYFRNLQFKILPIELKNKMNRNTNVVVNDNIIKLHSNDRRIDYRERWIKNLAMNYNKNRI